MSGVHDSIAQAAFDSLGEQEQDLFRPYMEEFLSASWYPDKFADRSMSAEAKAKIDPDADLVIYPDPPEGECYQKILRLTETEAQSGVAPLRQAFLVEHYSKLTMDYLSKGDIRLAVKCLGVYSHLVGDTTEPIHTVDATVIDVVVPPPPEHIGMELHANVEGLKAPVNIDGYVPQLLGATSEQVAMNAFAQIVAAKKIGAALIVPIVQALYAGDRDRATELSSQAQSASARFTADFMHTMAAFSLGAVEASRPAPLDLREYPHVAAETDMLYRFQPMKDVSLRPYSGGQMHPLSLLAADGKGVETVRGLGVAAYMGPPYDGSRLRKATVEYYLVPGAYKTFRARVGANPLFDETLIEAVFSVEVDNEEVYRSDVLGIVDLPVEVEAAIGRGRWLKLCMEDVGEPTREDVKRLHTRWVFHGVWAEPRLEA